jgi:porin
MTQRIILFAALALLTAPFTRAVDRGRIGVASKEDFLTGDWGGLRPAWSARGVDFGLTYTAGAYASVAGGRQRGAVLEGTGEFSFDLDLGKFAQWSDTRFHFSSVAAHGPSISERYVGDVNIISDYDLQDGLYLHEVWVEKGWFDNKLRLRVGKISADMEFPIYSYADTIPLPLYPTGAPGLRLYWAPNTSIFFQVAAYGGDPDGPGQGLNHGTRVRLARRDGATFIGEVGLNLGYAEGSTFPTGVWKFGVYHSTRQYADELSGATHHGNQAWFLNGDQTIWKENPEKKDDPQGLAWYLVAEYAPPDRNSYHYGFGGGPYYTGLFPGRDADMLYINFLYTRFSPDYAKAVVVAGGDNFIFENSFQAYYQIMLKKYWSITPEVDYVIRPGGARTDGRPRDALVFGVRMNLTF